MRIEAFKQLRRATLGLGTVLTLMVFGGCAVVPANSVVYEDSGTYSGPYNNGRADVVIIERGPVFVNRHRRYSRHHGHRVHSRRAHRQSRHSGSRHSSGRSSWQGREGSGRRSENRRHQPDQRAGTNRPRPPQDGRRAVPVIPQKGERRASGPRRDNRGGVNTGRRQSTRGTVFEEGQGG